MAVSRSNNQGKDLNKIPSLDYSNEEELNEDTRLMYEKYKDKMDDASLDVCIFMRDRTGIHVQLEEGHQAEADDLFDIVLQDQGLPAECEDVFALWLVSPLLELRLKKKHKPFFMVQQWDELCSKYTDAKAEEIHDDEPVLMFQRNVFFPKEQEVNITYEQVLRILYHEAKYNVLEGRYILNSDEYHTLAGIQALLSMDKYNSRDHIIETYRASLHQYYPEHVYRKPSGFFARRKSQGPKDAIEERWLNAHRQISQEYENEDIDSKRGELYRRYLEYLWPYPFYGAAFFDSFINKPQGKLGFLKRSHNIETWTAINTNGVCLIDREKDEVLLAVPYTELCWEYGEPQFDVDDDSFPCVFLQFLVNERTPDGVERRVTKVLQVYSRQAKMMIALIESCVERKKLLRRGIPAIDDVDGMTGQNEFHARCINKLGKMCLTTFTTSGMNNNQ
ncbi:putative FERM domain-containing protein FRMD8P1 isoform X3 [Mercenaria mercenaria]|nr:putative FERM domain-containing protein FRMD8P1 isoform X3 [Mercenaria mercenaria]